MLKRLIIYLLFFLSVSLIAQPTLDTISDCLKSRPQIFAKFDSRNSFISNSRAKIFGVKLGVSFGKRVHIGVGYNQLYPPANEFNKTIVLMDNNSVSGTVNTKLGMYYISSHFEYAFYQTKYWELSLPIQIGVGKTYYRYTFNNKSHKIEDSFNFIYEPAVSVEYKPIRWVGVGADIGYRFMIPSSNKLNQRFNSPTYAFKLLIYYSEIFKTVFPNSKFSKKL